MLNIEKAKLILKFMKTMPFPSFLELMKIVESENFTINTHLKTVTFINNKRAVINNAKFLRRRDTNSLIFDSTSKSLNSSLAYINNTTTLSKIVWILEGNKEEKSEYSLKEKGK